MRSTGVTLYHGIINVIIKRALFFLAFSLSVALRQSVSHSTYAQQQRKISSFFRGRQMINIRDYSNICCHSHRALQKAQTQIPRAHSLLLGVAHSFSLQLQQ
jgi:hypothetical protein